MALEGNLTDFGLADLFQLIGLGQRTGCLEIKGKSGSGEIYFDNGFIVHARSNTVEAEDSVYLMFNWNDGKFIFIPDKKSAKNTIMWDWQNLILEAARRSDELMEAKKLIPDDNAILAIVDSEDKSLENIHLTNDDLKVLSLVNGIRKVKEIIEKTHIDSTAAAKIITAMINAKIIEIKSIATDSSSSNSSSKQSSEFDKTFLNLFKRKKKFQIPNTAVGLLAEALNRFLDALFIDQPQIIINLKTVEEKVNELKQIYPVFQDVGFTASTGHFDAEALDWAEAGTSDANIIVKGLLEVLEFMFELARDENADMTLSRYRDMYQTIAKDATKMEMPSEAVMGLKNLPKK